MNTITLSKPITLDDGFHHFVYSISGNYHTIFFDGSAIAINRNVGNIFEYYQNISNLFIGTAGDLSYGYTGYIDDLKIFNRPLTITDVSAIYNANNAIINTIRLTIASGSSYFTTTSNKTDYYGFTTGTYTFTCSTSGTINYLIIGGGGGGGSSHGGGGGAGGVIYGSAQLVTGVTYTISVGSGGAVNNGNGSNSTLSGIGLTTITAYGGGYGGGSTGNAFSAGTSSTIIGSGGGGSGYTTSTLPGYTSSGQGNNGGTGGGNPAGGGGGGGAGTAGTTSVLSTAAGGLGGDGTFLHSSILSAISTNMNSIVSNWSTSTNVSGTYYIAAGGGGGTWGQTYSVNNYVAPGGKGGGGTGGTNNGPVVAAVAPRNNTGSGGGGGGSGGQTGTGGASGLVIITCTANTTPVPLSVGVLNNISAAGKAAMLKTGTTLQAGAYGLVKLNTLYTGATIQLKAGTGGTPTDFYAQSTTTYGTLQTLGGVSLTTFLGGQIAYVTKWYDQTGNGFHASNIGNITYNNTTHVVNFASNYFSVPDNAFPTGNSPYSYLFTPDNQTTNTNVVFQGGSLQTNMWVHGILNYSDAGTTAIYQSGWYANTCYYNKNLGGGFSNGVKIASCYDGTNGQTGMILYYNNVAKTFTGGNNATRNQTAGNNFIGHSEYNFEGLVNYTGSFKYFYWAPVLLSLSDITILNSV